MEKSLRTIPAWDVSQEQKGGHKRDSEKQQSHSLCSIDGLVSSKEFVVGATIPEVQRKSCAPK